jgi:hypothetical protein
MSASPRRALHARVFASGYVPAFLASTLAPALWRIARTGASTGFDGPGLIMLLTLGTLITAAAGAGLVLRVGRGRLSAWDAVHPRRSLLVAVLAGVVSAAVTESSLQIALLNGLAVVLRLVGLEAILSGPVTHPVGAAALMVRIVVFVLALAFCSGVAASVLVYFPWLAQSARADRFAMPAAGVAR